MTKKNKTAGSGNPIWQFFTSVKLTVIVLLLLASTSVIGTLIPQNGSEAFYIQKYGEVFYSLFNALDIFDMYNAWWFMLLLIVLAINIVVCSIDKLQGTWKIIFPKKMTFNIERFRRLKNKETFTCRPSEEKGMAHIATDYEALIRKQFGTVMVDMQEAGTVIFGETGRWTRIGVYVVHISILFMLIGAVIGSVWGYKAFVTIPEGESIQTAPLRGSDKVVDLGFSLRCNTFDVSFYDTGQPKEFKSNLTITDGEKSITTDIIVNDPLRYKGLSFYQSSYGTHSAKNVIFKITSSESGMAYSTPMKFGQTIDMPEFGGKFTLHQFVRGYNFRGHNLGEGFVGTLAYMDDTDHGDGENEASAPQSRMEKAMAVMADKSDGVNNDAADKNPSDGGDGESNNSKMSAEIIESQSKASHMHQVEIYIPVKFPTFDKMRRGRFVFEIEDYEKKYYTGLQITKDPGVWYVYGGFILMIVGCWITFFMSHQQVCIEIAKNDDEQKNADFTIHVSGTTNKNSQGMKLKLVKLIRQLKAL